MFLYGYKTIYIIINKLITIISYKVIILSFNDLICSEVPRNSSEFSIIRIFEGLVYFLIVICKFRHFNSNLKPERHILYFISYNLTNKLSFAKNLGCIVSNSTHSFSIDSDHVLTKNFP